MVCRLAGNSLWSASQYLGFGFVTPVAPQDVAYAISYSLLVGAMLHLVALTTRRITLVSRPRRGSRHALTAVLIRVDPAANSQRGRTNLQYLQA